MRKQMVGGFVRSVLVCVAIGLLMIAGQLHAEGQEGDPEQVDLRAPWVGDLHAILDRGFIRVVVSPSRTNFFADKEDLRGVAVDWINAFADQLNTGRKRSERVRVVWVPRSFGAMLPALRDGLGDLAIGGLTVLPSREQGIVFSDPYMTGVDEVVVQNRKVKGIKTIDDLAGKVITLRTDTSYELHLRQISKSFVDRGLKPPKIKATGEHLVTEDILEFVNAGIVDLTVADRHLAEAWAQVMPNLVVRPDLPIATGGSLAVAVRVGNPQLLESLNRFVRANKKGTLLGNMLFTRYFKNRRWLKAPGAEGQQALDPKIKRLFQKYAALFNFDWLNIAAQAYRESRFDNSLKSRAGAVGVMQIRPSTAADPHVGIDGVDQLENNIHAGVKYLAFLRDRYFDDPGVDPDNQLSFALAAYNVGPSRIADARGKAAEEDLDPNLWFENVELIVAKSVGREPVDYVRDIRALAFALETGEEEMLKRELDRKSLLN